MTKPRAKTSKYDRDEIHVTKLKDIGIVFPGDIYSLAVWTAMSDRGKSSPTSRVQTTLHGLANKFVSMHGMDYAHPLTVTDVMDTLRKQGIKGNPLLYIRDEEEPALVVQWNDAV
jgi:hypothetical protein